MEITLADAGDVKIARFDGMIDGATVPEVETTLFRLLEDGANKLLLDLEQLTYINSAGLRVILMVAKRLNKSEGKLRICSLNPHVKGVFDISGFSTILTILESEREALETF